MNAQIRLGRIAGIPIGANWSVLVVLWLLAWSLATQQLPDSHPGQSTTAYWVVGVITAVVFMASLLAHELGHSLVARRLGVSVERITLWLFGGVATLRDESPTPRVDLLIAVAGPAVSITFGGFFLAASLILDSAKAPPLNGAAAAWLGVVNLVLAAFNLIPAAPLDGGRVLRAVLWMIHGDRTRATVQAVRAGRTFGYLLIFLGILQFSAGLGVSGLWFVFLGWFLLNAANAEATDALLRQSLQGVTVRQVMTPDPVTAPADLDADRLLHDYVMAHRGSAFPLLDPDGTFRGLVTLARLKRIPADRRAATPIVAVAAPPDEIPQVGPDDSVIDLIDRLGRSPDRRAVVVDGGRIIGIVTPTDVARTIEWASLGPR